MEPCLANLCVLLLQGFLAEGLQRTTAGLGSIIIDSQPLTVALLATLLLGESFTTASAAGLVLGVLGLILLELPQETVLSLPQQLAGGTSCCCCRLGAKASALKRCWLDRCDQSSVGMMAAMPAEVEVAAAMLGKPALTLMQRRCTLLQVWCSMVTCQQRGARRWPSLQSASGPRCGTAGRGGCCWQRRAWLSALSWCPG